jgi:hypothetical protein
MAVTPNDRNKGDQQTEGVMKELSRCAACKGPSYNGPDRLCGFCMKEALALGIVRDSDAMREFIKNHGPASRETRDTFGDWRGQRR